MMKRMPTHCVQAMCSWKTSIAAIIPKTYARLLSGYACEKDQCLRMYIQSTPAAVKETPHASHHQLVSWLNTNDHVRETGPMACSASFKNNCPPQRKILCMMAKRISFISPDFYKLRHVLCRASVRLSGSAPCPTLPLFHQTPVPMHCLSSRAPSAPELSDLHL